jgi:hypothetical protein
MENVGFQVLKSISQPFRVGESHSMSTPGIMAASMHRVLLGANAMSLSTHSTTHNASVVFPSSLASSLLLPSASNVDVAIHVFQHAPIIAGTVPVTPLVSVQMALSASGAALNVSNLPDGIYITLPLTAKIFNHQALEYECMYWNGTGYGTHGCVATGLKTATSVQCACNHLTTFVARVRICMCVCVFMLALCFSFEEALVTAPCVYCRSPSVHIHLVLTCSC